MRYVVAIALKYRRYGLPVVELMAEGNFGIVHALAKFDPERGNRFVTYAAHWIRTYILTYIIRSWSLVGGGSGALRSRMFFRLRRERIRITNSVGEGDHVDEMLAQRFNTSSSQISEMMGRLETRDVSLDSMVLREGARSLMDTLTSSDVDQEEVCVRVQDNYRVNTVVHAALATLDRRERAIIEGRLMTDPEDQQTLAELGRSLGITRERVRQIEVHAKTKLKQRLSSLSGNTRRDFSAESTRRSGAAIEPLQPLARAAASRI
jgi:RNA polymerase sigma-32 factor